MANNPDPISYINLGDGQNHPIDAVTLGEHPASDFQSSDAIVTSISSSSTDQQIPSAKCVYTELSNIETRLQNI